MFTFTNNVVSGNASVTSGTGTVSGSPTFSGNTMTVDLTGVTDQQQITVTASNVTDTFGQAVPDTAVNAIILVADTNANARSMLLMSPRLKASLARRWIRLISVPI